MGIDEKSGQLIECVNPAHLYFGSIHYIQPDCVSKIKLEADTKKLESQYGQIISNAAMAVFGQKSRFDSDESWQASEALLKR